MPRKKNGFLEEGSDSDDSVPSDVDTTTSQRAPSFVPAQGASSSSTSSRRTFPSFVRAAPADKEDEKPSTFSKRTFGAGLGRTSPPASMAVDEDEDRRPGLGAAPAPHTAGPALSRTSGSGGFDPAAYMRQMGWTGGGLGKEGEGIVNPIEVQLRPSRAGVAFGGRREKTKQERQEERRRAGLPMESDEEDDKGTTAKATTQDVSTAWKKRTQRQKPKVVYRTYDEIMAEAAGVPPDAPVLDATRGDAEEVASVAAALARHPVPTSDSAQLPELRHNLRLLCKGQKEALDKLAHHGMALRDKARWLRRDVEASSLRWQKEQAERTQLASVLDALTTLSDDAAHATSLETLAPSIDRLVQCDAAVIQAFGLDEAVAGALVPVLRQSMATWDPLREPHRHITQLQAWLPILQMQPATSDTTPRPMTPWESVLWNVWMPTIRTTLTNAWDVYDAAPAVGLVEAWRPVLPAFVLDNVLDQLILPKLERAVQAWTLSTSIPLHVFVLPWLPLCEARLDMILHDTRRQWRRVLSTWRVSDGVPAALLHWRTVYATKEWDALLLERIVPVLSQALRTQFVVDPRDQDMTLLAQVVAWQGVLRDSVLSRVLETELGAKWLMILHQWLTQPGAVSWHDIGAWYEFWRGWFSPATARLDGIAHMLLRGLRHINAALDRGADRVDLPPPNVTPTSRSSQTRTNAPAAKATPMDAPPTLEEVSLRHVIEEKATDNDLFVRALNQLEPTTGFALLRISPHIDGKMGVTFYIDDDVIFAATASATASAHACNEYDPMSLAELLQRACTP